MYHRMWGAARHDRSAGVHRPLTASVVVFQQLDSEATSATRQMLIALDHCLLDVHEVDLLTAAVVSATGIEREAILVTYSHTHAAGLMNRDRIDLPGGDLIPDYLEAMYATVAALAMEALTNLRDATITYGDARCNLAANRDFWDEANETWVCGLNPDGPADDTVVVARVTDREEQLVATIVNYACHPTTLAWDNQQISPDYPGAMREVVEQATGAPCVFLQGAAGDLGPREGFVGDVGVADRNGRQLGYAALSAITALPPANQSYRYQGPVVSGATIGAWKHEAHADERHAQSSTWRLVREELPIAYRPELRSADEVAAEREQLCSEEAAARQAGDDQRASDLRALIERRTRTLAWLRTLPANIYPYQIGLWRLGDAIWVAIQGEPYHVLQTSLRKRFPGVPVFVLSPTNGWGASYLVPSGLYGTGIYQETVAVLEKGCLERVIEEVAEKIECCLRNE
jgi:hypothetical protein